MTKYLVPSAGTYNCRTIAGTDRRSMHAYGAAIDINTKFTDYWLWAKPAGGLYPTATGFRSRSSTSSSATASSGAASGTTTTRCTSNTGRSCSPSRCHRSSCLRQQRHYQPAGDQPPEGGAYPVEATRPSVATKVTAARQAVSSRASAPPKRAAARLPRRPSPATAWTRSGGDRRRRRPRRPRASARADIGGVRLAAAAIQRRAGSGAPPVRRRAPP